MQGNHPHHDYDNVGARFLKKVGNGRYQSLNTKQIREKEGHCFRDMSNQNRVEKAKMAIEVHEINRKNTKPETRFYIYHKL